MCIRDRRSAGSNSISPRIARSVILATCAFRPAKSASSSMHSWPIMVESMSARKSFLRRKACGCTTMSIGKSPLAIALAQKTGGVIVNADSMQVYRDLRIITARPTPEEEALIPHRLYGHVDAAINFSAGHWVADAAKALAEARAQARLPIYVGGSGLYFKALTRGLSAVPPIPAGIR